MSGLNIDEFNYARRTLRHIQKVQELALVVARSTLIDCPGTAKRLVHNATAHDQPKFSPEEWGLTQRYWTELDEEGRKNPEEMERYAPAWAHHKANTYHHQECWDTDEVVRPEHVFEMVCDWAAMSMELNAGDERIWSKELEAWAITMITQSYLEYYKDTVMMAVNVIQDYWAHKVTA